MATNGAGGTDGPGGEVSDHTSAWAHRLVGKAVVVTGGGSGIGQATALRLAAEGAAVLLADLNADGAQAVAAAIANGGGRAEAVRVDVTDSEDVQAAVAACRRHFGRIDGLVACAGVSNPEPFLELRPETWHNTLNIHLTGTFACAQAAARAMVGEGHGGAIVCLSSTAGAAYVSPLGCDYHVAKAGMLGLVRTMASELAPYGIRANAIGPGVVITPMTEPRMADPDVQKQARGRIPLQRFAKPEEMAAVIAFLLSDDASYVTGQCIFADGGSLSRI